MAKSKRSAEEVCVEYAIAAASVREHSKILSLSVNQCDAVTMFHESGAEFLNGVSAPDSCMTQHWQVETYAYGDVEYRERPALAYDDMCDGCKVRLKAFEDRREARRRLGSAKRAVEAIGKREAARG
jgi:hypothetical protein